MNWISLHSYLVFAKVARFSDLTDVACVFFVGSFSISHFVGQRIINYWHFVQSYNIRRSVFLFLLST